MKFAEAFSKLGYRLVLPRQHWSAQSETGVCLSLWRTELQWKPTLWMDTRIHCGVVSLWNPAGANKRREHLRLAIEKFHGWIDAVIVDGVPGQPIKDAEPWNVSARGKQWRLEDVDLEIGHFTVRACDPP